MLTSTPNTFQYKPEVFLETTETTMTTQENDMEIRQYAYSHFDKTSNDDDFTKSIAILIKQLRTTAKNVTCHYRVLR